MKAYRLSFLYIKYIAPFIVYYHIFINILSTIRYNMCSAIKVDGFVLMMVKI